VGLIWVIACLMIVSAAGLRRIGGRYPCAFALSRLAMGVGEALLGWVLLVQPFLLTQFEVPSPSMSPTLKAGDRLLASPVTYRFRSPRRGEIAIFTSPQASPLSLRRHVKRVIGVEGDTVSIRRAPGDSRSVVLLNGETLPESYVHEPMAYEFPACDGENDPSVEVVPAGAVFVLGDNRNVSVDSHVFGCVPLDSVGQRGLVVLSPWWSVRVLDAPVAER